MAKSKEDEAQYKIEKARRTKIRKRARKDLKKANKRYKITDCPDCGGFMSWCSICEDWTQDCCQEFGSCQCS